MSALGAGAHGRTAADPIALALALHSVGIAPGPPVSPDWPLPHAVPFPRLSPSASQPEAESVSDAIAASTFLAHPYPMSPTLPPPAGTYSAPGVFGMPPPGELAREPEERGRAKESTRKGDGMAPSLTSCTLCISPNTNIRRANAAHPHKMASKPPRTMRDATHGAADPDPEEVWGAYDRPRISLFCQSLRMRAGANISDVALLREQPIAVAPISNVAPSLRARGLSKCRFGSEYYGPKFWIIRLPNGKFRVLIAGRANTGKTSILQSICDTTESPKTYGVTGGRREEWRRDFKCLGFAAYVPAVPPGIYIRFTLTLDPPVKPEIMHQTQPLETNPVTTPAAPEDSAPITPAGPRKDVPIQPALDTGCARRGHRVRKPKDFIGN
ncbi:hypothetical protein B0H14DRAFT_2616963 [Mycena olivaceomarginata]|nr:hypothetical protein B0H14DRAFT_2616963 [Mycena olivaceomarginata]